MNQRIWFVEVIKTAMPTKLEMYSEAKILGENDFNPILSLRYYFTSSTDMNQSIYGDLSLRLFLINLMNELLVGLLSIQIS